MKYCLLTFLFLIAFSSVRLAAQTDDSWKLYSDTTVGRVDITIDTSYLSWIYAHVDSDSEFYAQIHFHNTWIDESVDSIGFRLRGNTSRDSQKKSFKVSFNSFIKGRKFHSVKKLNLNGEHNDPSIIRTKLSFDLYREIGMAASRVAHTRVYINGQYYGLYVSVEDVGEDFLTKHYKDDTGNLWKCLYPADLQYLGDASSTYSALISDGRPVYELQTNEATNDFSQIARLARILNQTPANAMADSLDAVIDVPTVLKYFAMNVMVGSWDDYRSLMNNYYLYHNPTTNRLTVIPYDYDNTFGIDWSGNNWSAANPYDPPKVASGPRPLSEAILAQVQYRDLFTHFLKFYNTNLMPLPRWESRIDRIRDSITSAASEDTYRTRDWGFTMDDFYNSYSATSYQNQQAKFGLKQFINLRTASLPSQLNFVNAPPQAYTISVSSTEPGPNDSVLVTAACFGIAGVKKVELIYTPEGSVWQQVYLMEYSPVAGTVVENADRWVASMPPLGIGSKGTVTVRVTDSLDRVQVSPRTSPITIRSTGLANGGLVINELLADNTNVLADQNGEYDDWLELYNPTASPVRLTGLYLTDNPAKLNKWRFTQPDLSIAPGAHLLVWCDDQGTQAGIHTNFKFSKSGEFAAITDSDGVTVIDSFSFGPQESNISLGRFPDGGPLLGQMAVTPESTNTAVHGAGRMQVLVAKGWNMVSLPLIAADGKTGTLYPHAASRAFEYHARYIAVDSLRTGNAFWLKFDIAHAFIIPGTIFTAETLSLQPGWNMIGAGSVEVPVADITSLTPDLSTSNFYAFQNQYYTVDTLQPGKGYWVKSDKSGMIRIASGTDLHGANRLRVVPNGELPPSPPEILTEGSNSVRPTSFMLEQNYPNPFNPTTTIHYQLPEESFVRLSLYNVLGQEVRTLVNTTEQPGYKSVSIDAANLPSGLYFYRITAVRTTGDKTGSFTDVKKMLLVR